jgi:hypothetical protein
MRLVRLLLLVLGLAVGLPLGGLLLFVTVELKTAAREMQPTPQVLSAAQLADKGTAENLHVELTEFTFGKPVIEKGEQGWKYVWLPVEPTPRPKKKAAKHALFFRAEVADQAALDEVLKRTRLEALLASALPNGSRWQATPSPALRQAYPKLKAGEALVLAEPRLSLLGQTVAVSDPRLYDPDYESLGAWGGGGLILFAFVALWLGVRSRPGREEAGSKALPASAAAQRAQLEAERPVSFHRRKSLAIFPRVCFFGLLAVFLLFLAVVTALAAVQAQSEGKPLFAVLFVFFGVITLLGARVAGRAWMRQRRWPTDIEVCYSGLRWREGRQRRCLLWAEVAEVRRDVKFVPRVGQTGLVGAFAQLNNPQPPIRVDTLSIELSTGESYCMTPNLVTDYSRLADSANNLWVDDVRRREVAPFTNAWLNALPSR